jgi:hypothetical protein
MVPGRADPMPTPCLRTGLPGAVVPGRVAPRRDRASRVPARQTRCRRPVSGPGCPMPPRVEAANRPDGGAHATLSGRLRQSTLGESAKVDSCRFDTLGTRRSVTRSGIRDPAKRRDPAAKRQEPAERRATGNRDSKSAGALGTAVAERGNAANPEVGRVFEHETAEHAGPADVRTRARRPGHGHEHAGPGTESGTRVRPTTRRRTRHDEPSPRAEVRYEQRDGWGSPGFRDSTDVGMLAARRRAFDGGAPRVYKRQSRTSTAIRSGAPSADPKGPVLP